MILLALLAALAWAPHPDSLSSSRLRVLGAEAHLTLRCQAASLLEAFPGLDADGDGALEAGELAKSERAVLDYVAAHYRLTAGSARDSSGGTPLVPEGRSARLVAETSPSDGAGAGALVDVDVVYRSPEPIRDLLIEVSLFRETSPGHIEVTSLQWADAPSETFVLRADRPRVRSDPSGRGAFLAFLKLGWNHILGGWDHIAFLLALLFATRRLRSLVGVVTAFTVGHSITLAVAALELVDVARFSGFIEAVIALSIAYVAAENVVLPRQDRTRWPEALLFGLVHGLGFAGFLMGALLGESSRVVPLFAFNLGVELGQLVLVAAAVVLLGHLPGPYERGDFLAPAPLRRWGSLVIALLGLFWFWQRL